MKQLLYLLFIVIAIPLSGQVYVKNSGFGEAPLRNVDSNKKGNGLYVVIGGNYSSVAKSTLSTEPLFQTNPVFGLGKNLSLTNKISLNTEFQYSVKGFKTKGAFVFDGTFLPNANSNYRVHYLDFVPHLELGIGKHTSLLAGFNASVKLLETINDISLERLNLPPNKKYDFGYLIGGKLTYRQIWLRLMANIGLINMLEDSPDLIHENRTIQLTVGFNLNVDKA